MFDFGDKSIVCIRNVAHFYAVWTANSLEKSHVIHSKRDSRLHSKCRSLLGSIWTVILLTSLTYLTFNSRSRLHVECKACTC